MSKNRINLKNYEVSTSSDFIVFDNYKSINKALKTIKKENINDSIKEKNIKFFYLLMIKNI